MPEPPIRVAAVGDVHAAEFTRATIETAFCDVDADADVLLLAGDLTATGDPHEGELLAEALRPVNVPVLAVLGNHDWHADRTRELVAVLADAGVRVLEREAARLDVGGRTLGIAGAKGFVGGFPGSHLPDFGEPLLRRVYREATADVAGLDAALHALDGCDHRVVLLHYAPTDETLAGEPPGIHAFLGTDRLAGPLREHRPDLVLHGHAHAGTHAGDVDGIPVFNVAAPMLPAPYVVFALDGGAPTPVATSASQLAGRR
jgi:Icc-related predicted phosphoesterase